MKQIKRFLKVCFIVFIGILSIFTYRGYKLYKSAIDNKPISEYIEEVRQKESFTKFGELPQIYVDAVLAAEDHRFYDHFGVDVVAITRALVNDIKAKKIVEGGSTITQQVAKNAYFSLDRTFERKIAEIFMAFELEKLLDKDEIFELYVNTSYFGDGCYSVREASNAYFKKEPIKMTEYEAIMLAGIPNAPSIYAPTKNIELAKQRQKQVIEKMIEYNYLTQEMAEEILLETDNFTILAEEK